MELAVAKEELFYKVEKCWETGTQRRVTPGAGITRHHQNILLKYRQIRIGRRVEFTQQTSTG